MTKRLGALILLLSLVGAATAQAQSYPARTITLGGRPASFATWMP